MEMFWRRQKGGAGTSSLQQAALDEIARTWILDGSDSTPRDDGFDWLPGSHAVRVRVQQNHPAGLNRHRITVATDFLRAVPLREKTIVSTAGEIASAICPTFANVLPTRESVEQHLDGPPAEVQFFSSAYVDEHTASWIPGFLAHLSILQPSLAEHWAETMQENLGGVLAFANGTRNAHPSDILAVDQLIKNAGSQPSRWAGSEEFEDAAEGLAGNLMYFATADDNSLTLETSYGSDSALVRFMTDLSQPLLGNGLLVLMHIRSSQTYEQTCRQAARLNYLESAQWTDFPQLGCWHASKPYGNETAVLEHSSFIPNLYFRKGLVQNYVWWSISRAQWARTILKPDEQNLTMREILEARYGIK
jgi:hypothetical protein